METPTCCCGRLHCAYLDRNNAALEGLEKDLRNAAQIGQALLARHEAFVLDAEDERRRMSASIGKLEEEKKDLETANARTIQDNRALLDQLEEMNSSVASSDAQIQALTATLQSTRNEIERLTVLAARATDLESQMSTMESEQASFQEELSSKQEDHRSAVQRWRNAERTIGQLQEQVDRIEREAMNERQRHVEVVGRLERRRVVERELETAAGRLKGAAAATTLGKDYGGSSVVSHFVKDILQDNANLQSGIVELRDMLLGSNAEVENLREQMMLHQPLGQTSKGQVPQSPLRDELAQVDGLDTVPELAPELHVHHHYHGPERADKVARGRSSTPLRRPKKKRAFTSSGCSTPSAGTLTPRSHGIDLRIPSPSSASTILSQTSVSIPPHAQAEQSQVWAIPSPHTRSSVAASSVPSSPQSAHPGSSIFDYLDTTADSSRPTSPESLSSESPFFPSRQKRHGSDESQRSFSSPTVRPSRHASTLQPSSSPAADDEEPLSEIDAAYFDHATILEEPEDEALPTASPDQEEAASITDSRSPSFEPFKSSLRRSASHESILSAKEDPMPTLRSKHSQLLNRQPTKSRTSLSIASPRIEPVISSMSALANPSLQSRGQDSRDYNRSILSGATSHSHEGPEKSKSTFGQKMGGWAWGKWGVAPMASSGNLRAKAASNAAGSVEERLRASQMGKSKAKGPPRRVMSTPEAGGIDERLLKESLAED